MPHVATLRVAGSLLPLLLAAGLLYLGAPRTIAAFVSLPGDYVLERIQIGESVSARNLETLIISRERALAWVEAGRVRTDLALAQLVLAKASGEDGAYDQAGMARAIESLRAGLARAPARPYAWVRLALAELEAGGPSPEVAKPLEMALISARYIPRLLFVRLELCLIAWPYLNSDARDLVFQQVRIAWHRSPDRLVDLALHMERLDVVRTALLISPLELEAFEKRLQQSEE
jgi:hypothetical protein